MFDNSREVTTQDTPNHTAQSITLEQREARNDEFQASLPDLLKVVGVTSKSHDRYQTNLRTELDRIRSCEDTILKRTFRESVSRLAACLEEIITNCDEDPNDIREEIALPTILRRISDSLDEYLATISRPFLHADVAEQLDATESMFTDAIPWLEQLLDRMRANDGIEAHLRARVLSNVFEPQFRGGSGPKDGPGRK